MTQQLRCEIERLEQENKELREALKEAQKSREFKFTKITEKRVYPPYCPKCCASPGTDQYRVEVPHSRGDMLSVNTDGRLFIEEVPKHVLEAMLGREV